MPPRSTGRRATHCGQAARGSKFAHSELASLAMSIDQRIAGRAARGRTSRTPRACLARSEHRPTRRGQGLEALKLRACRELASLAVCIEQLVACRRLEELASRTAALASLASCAGHSQVADAQAPDLRCVSLQQSEAVPINHGAVPSLVTLVNEHRPAMNILQRGPNTHRTLHLRKAQGPELRSAP